MRRFALKRTGIQFCPFVQFLLLLEIITICHDDSLSAPSWTLRQPCSHHRRAGAHNALSFSAPLPRSLVRRSAKMPLCKFFVCHSYGLPVGYLLCLPLIRKHPGWWCGAFGVFLSFPKRTRNISRANSL